MNKKSVLITGSSRGIGRAIALKLAHDGFDIVLHCRGNLAAAESVADELRALNAYSRTLVFDIADRKACRELIEQDIETHGCYYGVVCNAGINRDNAFPALSEEDWDSVIHTNLDGFFNVLQPIIMPMVRTRKPARIVALSSVSGLVGNHGQVNYSASKAGIIGAVKALAVELAKRSITVNCVAPGIIETDMIQDLPLKEMLDVIPMRRLGRPEEVAAAVSFLISEDASYMTRQVISVNGGMC